MKNGWSISVTTKLKPESSPENSEVVDSKFKIPREEAVEKIELLNKIIEEKKHLDADLNERIR